jgi:hypothetical protein
MKTHIISCSIAALLLLALASIPGSCKKDENSPDSWRVNSMSQYIDNNLIAVANLYYSGEKYTSNSGYDYSIGDSTKSVFTYPDDNSVMVTDYNKIYGQWVVVARGEYIMQNGLATQLVYYESVDDVMTPFLKINMTYQSGNVIEETWSFYMDDWYPLMKLLYTYNGDKVIQSTISQNLTGSWEIAYKEVVTYSGELVDVVVESEYDGQAYYESYKYDYTYADNLLTKVEYLEFDGSSWLTNEIHGYTYDSNGNLLSETIDYPDEVDKTVYTYEEGKGNFYQLSFFYNSGSVSGFFMPRPTKATRGSFADIEKYLAKIKE